MEPQYSVFRRRNRFPEQESTRFITFDATVFTKSLVNVSIELRMQFPFMLAKPCRRDGGKVVRFLRDQKKLKRFSRVFHNTRKALRRLRILTAEILHVDL